MIVSPNPVSSSIQIQGKAETSGTIVMRMINSAGHEVLAERFSVSEGVTYSRFVDIYHLPPGMYIVEVQEGSNKTSKKVLKQ